MSENKKKISFEEIEHFLNGSNPMERVISVDVGYNDDRVKIIYHNKDGQRCIKHDYFYPFVWAKFSICDKMCGGDRTQVKRLLQKYNVSVKKLRSQSDDGTEELRMANGYKFIFKAKTPMSYSKFLKFFKEVGTPVYSDRNEEENEIPKAQSERQMFLTVTPQEQYMIGSGIRLFKGYEGYDSLKRMQFDLETDGLNPETDRINQIGIRTNRGFEKILSVVGETEEEKNTSELRAIENTLKIIYTEDPDIIAGYNSENFDWNFFIVRTTKLGQNFGDMSKKYFDGRPIYKSQKPSTLKLGGEVETYYQTIVPDHIVLDGLHAVRRAQATDSSILKADLKYITKFLSLNKENRVYVPGDKINKTWKINEPVFAHNDLNGDWYQIDEKHPLKEGYTPKTGRYIVERYLLDDLWETDKVELQMNEANFQIGKIVPTGFARISTMGTAGIWKLIILAWSFEQELAIPAFGTGGQFTGGLSRILGVGYTSDVIKLDYNSLYPSIMLSWHIDPKIDVQGVLPAMLEYVLTQREKYKKLKKEANKKVEALRKKYKETNNLSLLPEIQHWENEEVRNDRLQNPFKILGNSAFGSFGAENLFPLGSKECAERITCTGRQSLRLMISWFMKLGYKPIVGDSFTPDTPIFIKYNNSGQIDIKPISELINEEGIKIDELGREYDYTKKPYKVLARSGWVEAKYIYRHKTDKDIYEVTDGDARIEVTEDHSLFNSNGEKIKPSEITENTKLEYYNGEIKPDGYTRYFSSQTPYIFETAKKMAFGEIDRVPIKVLNYPPTLKHLFYTQFMKNYRDNIQYSKTCVAGLQFLKKTCIV